MLDKNFEFYLKRLQTIHDELSKILKSDYIDESWTRTTENKVNVIIDELKRKNSENDQIQKFHNLNMDAVNLTSTSGQVEWVKSNVKELIEILEFSLEKPSNNRVDDLKKELSSELNEKCKEIIVDRKNWKKFRKRVYVSFLIAIGIFIIGALVMPEGKEASDVPEIFIPVLVTFFIALIYGGKQERNAEKERRKILGYNKLTLFSYEALKHIEEYEKELDFENINKSKDKINSILNNLEINWDEKYRTNLSFKALEAPIENLKNALRQNFIPAFSDIKLDEKDTNKEEIKKRKITLIYLIQMFQNENFHLVNEVIKDLQSYIPNEKPPEKTRWQKLQENRTKVKIIISVVGSIVIFTGSVYLSYTLAQHPDATELEKYNSFITWSIATVGIGVASLNAILMMWKK